MTIDQLKNALPEHAKDIKLNLVNVLSTDGAPDLTQKQIYTVALASAYATKNAAIIAAIHTLANPGVDKVDFELNCLAVSALNGCGMCMDAHARELNKAGISKLAVQSAVRIAAVLNAVANGYNENI